MNALGVCPRDVNEIMKRWHDIWGSVKKKIAALHKASRVTGLGLPPRSPLTPTEEKIIQTFDHLTLDGMGGMDTSALDLGFEQYTGFRMEQEKQGGVQPTNDGREYSEEDQDNESEANIPQTLQSAAGCIPGPSVTTVIPPRPPVQVACWLHNYRRTPS
ncbi:t-SNARE domain-containing protein 1-like [Acipenser ruthenus]|uniref:t-SNARE domain-containing protein 1-like n=1 Tax=Acipenser ruthenus TaxID=7906 RepID=UPI0015601E40|nr:t-SNARE domain-containing protein 1-like [Acipenser ruthenus]